MARQHLLRASPQAGCLRCHLALALFIGSWPAELYAERPARGLNPSTAVLQLRPTGSLTRSRHGKVRKSMAATAKAGSSRPALLEKNGTGRSSPRNWHAHTDEWLSKFDKHIDTWNSKAQAVLNEKAYDAIAKSKSYFEKKPILDKGTRDMQQLVAGLRASTENMANKENSEIGDLLAAGKGHEAPLLPDSFPVPRPGRKVQPGDNWEAPPNMEDLVEENARLKQELEASRAKLAYHAEKGSSKDSHGSEHSGIDGFSDIEHTREAAPVVDSFSDAEQAHSMPPPSPPPMANTPVDGFSDPE